MTAEADKTESDRIMLKVKSMEVRLKEIHVRLLKHKSPKYKESDPVRIDAEIRFNKTDYTDAYGISMYDRN